MRDYELDVKKTKVIKTSVKDTRETLKVQNSGLRADTEVVFLTPNCSDLFSSSFFCLVSLIFQKH